MFGLKCSIDCPCILQEHQFRCLCIRVIFRLLVFICKNSTTCPQYTRRNHRALSYVAYNWISTWNVHNFVNRLFAFNILCTPTWIVKPLIDQFFIPPSYNGIRPNFLLLCSARNGDVLWHHKKTLIKSELTPYIICICCVDAIRKKLICEKNNSLTEICLQRQYAPSWIYPDSTHGKFLPVLLDNQTVHMMLSVVFKHVWNKQCIWMLRAKTKRR